MTPVRSAAAFGGQAITLAIARDGQGSSAKSPALLVTFCNWPQLRDEADDAFGMKPNRKSRPRLPCLRIRLLPTMQASLRTAAQALSVSEAQLVRLGIRLVLDAVGRDRRPAYARVGLPDDLRALALQMPPAPARRGSSSGRRGRGSDAR